MPFGTLEYGEVSYDADLPDLSLAGLTAVRDSVPSTATAAVVSSISLVGLTAVAAHVESTGTSARTVSLSGLTSVRDGVPSVGTSARTVTLTGLTAVAAHVESIGVAGRSITLIGQTAVASVTPPAAMSVGVSVVPIGQTAVARIARTASANAFSSISNATLTARLIRVFPTAVQNTGIAFVTLTSVAARVPGVSRSGIGKIMVGQTPVAPPRASSEPFIALRRRPYRYVTIHTPHDPWEGWTNQWLEPPGPCSIVSMHADGFQLIITTATPHGLHPTSTPYFPQFVEIAGTSLIDGISPVFEILSPTQFSLPVAGSLDFAGPGGTVTPLLSAPPDTNDDLVTGQTRILVFSG